MRVEPLLCKNFEICKYTRAVSRQQLGKTPFLFCCAIVVFLSVAAGTYLPSGSHESALVYLLISQ
jgi:hypothetical protein